MKKIKKNSSLSVFLFSIFCIVAAFYVIYSSTNLNDWECFLVSSLCLAACFCLFDLLFDFFRSGNNKKNYGNCGSHKRKLKGLRISWISVFSMVLTLFIVKAVQVKFMSFGYIVIAVLSAAACAFLFVLLARLSVKSDMQVHSCNCKAVNRSYETIIDFIKSTSDYIDEMKKKNIPENLTVINNCKVKLKEYFDVEKESVVSNEKVKYLAKSFNLSCGYIALIESFFNSMSKDCKNYLIIDFIQRKKIWSAGGVLKGNEVICGLISYYVDQCGENIKFKAIASAYVFFMIDVVDKLESDLI